MSIFFQKPSLTWQKFRDFIARPTHSRTMGILTFFILIAVISLTVYVAQQQQQLRQRASAPYDICSVINQFPPCGDLQSNCSSESAKCKADKNIIYECQKQ